MVVFSNVTNFCCKIYFSFSLFEKVCDYLGVNDFMGGGAAHYGASSSQNRRQNNTSVGGGGASAASGLPELTVDAGCGVETGGGGGGASSSEVDLSSNQDALSELGQSGLAATEATNEMSDGYFCQSSGDESVKYFDENKSQQ